MISEVQVAGKPVTRPAVAIIGMSCLFPGAADLVRYWANLVNATDAIREISPAEFDKSKYGRTAETPAFRSESEAFQHAYTTRGGYITEYADFDPLKYGVMPNSLSGMDPDQLLSLRLAVDAMEDAGYATRDFDRERAQVVLGRTMAPSIGVMNLIQTGQTVQQVMDAVKALCPQYTDEDFRQIESAFRSSLRQCNADTIPGVMPNVIAGRIAGKLGFQGRNLVLDAACASSLVAVEVAVRELLAGEADLVVTGGVHINSCAAFSQMFCGLGAMSRSGIIRPFDENADGTLVGEGAGVLVLKRLEDAIRDGDRIYATIIGVGTSSDGVGTAVLAPNVDGEALAIQRALQMAGIPPSTIGLLEAHGTATTVGDLAELQAIAQAWRGGQDASWCALGSVKSMIGHTQAAAGAAGLIKIALALHEKVLPPTLHVDKPMAKIGWERHPCYINTRTRPWIHPAAWETRQSPRRAAASAFGFGGINAHVILEEAPFVRSEDHQTKLHETDSEVIVFNAKDRDSLLYRVQELRRWLADNPDVDLQDVAFSWNTLEPEAKGEFNAAIVVRSTGELHPKLAVLADELTRGTDKLDGNLTGVYVRSPEVAVRGKVAFLLPGLGSAYVNMLADLCLQFPVVREVFDYVDFLAVQNGERELPSSKIFPRTITGEDSGSLAKMDAAVVTVLMVEYALSELLRSLEIEPDVFLGCSTGEFAAITMSGAVDVLSAASQFYRMSVEVARALPEERLEELRTMRVFADYEKVQPLLSTLSEPVYLSSYLAPEHVILTGSEAAMKQCGEVLRKNSLDFHFLPIAIPYHTELVNNAVDTSQKEFRELTFVSPEKTAWLCSTASELPKDPEAVRKITTELFSKPIMLRETVQRMHEDGVRIFVEVGPRGGLTTLVGDILADKQHIAVASNVAGRPAVTQINHLLAQLFVNGVSMNLVNLYSRRSPKILDFTTRGAANVRSYKLDLTYPDIKLDPHFAYDMANKRAGEIAPISPSQPVVSGFGSGGTSQFSIMAPNAEAEVVSHYLQTMASFHEQLMNVQGQVFDAYFDQSAAKTEGVNGMPFVRGALQRFSEHELEVLYLLTLNEDQYLLDHAIGGSVRQLFGFAERVHLLPLMVALEIMAEVASIICTNQAVVRVENVRATERIRVGAEGFAVRVSARRTMDRKVLVELRRATEEGGAAMMSCEVVFDDQHPHPAPTPEAEMPNARAPRIQSHLLYTPQTMFHGPRMQAVNHIDAVSSRAITGAIADRAPVGWFGFMQNPLFLLNPLLLDNASQLVLYYLFEQDIPVIALLPFYIESIEFFGYPNVHETVHGKAQMHAITDRGTQASVEVRNAEGGLLLRLNNISSRRIALDELWLQFVHNPASQFLSGSAPALLSHLAIPSYGEVAACDESILSPDPVVVDWCADYLLTEQERLIWRQSARDEQRKREWLLGRIAVKEAVRRLVARHTGVHLLPQDVEILYDELGRPTLAPMFVQVIGWAPWVSIAHSNGMAIAVAINSEFPVGVDLQVVAPRDAEFIEFAFSQEEQRILNEAAPADIDRLAARLWSAKEALAKALGTGFQGAFRNGFVVTQFDPETGDANVAANLGETQYTCTVTTRCDDSYASALCVLLNFDESQLMVT